MPYKMIYAKLGRLIMLGWKHKYTLADLTVGKRPGTSNRIEIHFAVFNHLYLCFSLIYETR